jgi:tetratricopeptide (TPR) repeat protein
MAVAHVRMNQLDEAETKLDKALQLDPGQQAFKTLKDQIVKARQTRAENEAKSKVAGVLELNKAGKHSEAIARAKEVMDEVPDNLKKILWGEMANAYLALDQQDEGMEAYRQMMLLAGDPVDEGFFKLGQEYVKRGKQAQARKAFQKVLEVNPDHAEACYQLGMDYFYEQGDKENAKRLLEKYLKLGKDEANLDNARNVLVVIGRS